VALSTELASIKGKEQSVAVFVFVGVHSQCPPATCCSPCHLAALGQRTAASSWARVASGQQRPSSSGWWVLQIEGRLTSPLQAVAAAASDWLGLAPLPAERLRGRRPAHRGQASSCHAPDRRQPHGPGSARCRGPSLNWEGRVQLMEQAA
jgi:hypothetical protein